MKYKKSSINFLNPEIFANKKAVLLSVFLIFALGLAVYANALKGKFVWDDEYIVETNPLIKDFSYLPQVFSTGLFQAYGVGHGSYYRPIQVLTYMIDYRCWQLSPLGFHLTNIFLHISCAILFYFIVAMFTSDLRAALIAALLFVVHPLHTQAITYISGRADPLCILFFLISFIFFIKSFKNLDQGGLNYTYIGSLAFFILSLLCKETAITFPLFYIFFIMIFRPSARTNKFQWTELSSVIPFILMVIMYVALRATVLNFSDGTFLSQTPLYLRLLTSVKNIFVYVGLLILPLGLHMERPVEFVASFFDIKVLLALAALGIIAWWMRRIYRQDKALFFFVGWFFLGLVPVLNIVPLNATLSEHWIYLSSMGLFALLGILIPKQKWAYVGVTIVIIIYGYLTIQRNEDWRDPMSIYLNTKKYVPDDFMVRNNLGRAYLDQNRIDEAIGEFEACVRIQPLYAVAHSNLGRTYELKGWNEKAIEEYNRALELIPSLDKTYVNLANLYWRMGNREKAIEVYQIGLKNCPQQSFLEANFIGRK